MGAVCPSCYSERHNGELWTRTPDESPRLCARHIQLEHGADVCSVCGLPWKEHELVNSSIDGHTKVFACFPHGGAKPKKVTNVQG